MRGSPRNCGAMLCCLSLIASPFVHSDEPVLVYPDLPSLVKQQALQDALSASSYIVHNLDYVDGLTSEVLRTPYVLTFDSADNSLFVSSFTLNHVVRLRLDSVRRRKAKYKVFVSGAELDGPVGMEVVGDALYVASFTNDKVLRVNKTSGQLLGSFGNEEELDCPEG